MSAKAGRAGTTYIGGTANGGAVVIVVSRDRRQVRRVLFAFQTKCTDGGAIGSYEFLLEFPIAANRAFKVSRDTGPQTDPNVPGVTVRKIVSISGVINRRGSKIVGTARATSTITMAAGSGSCDTGLVRFTAND